MALTGYLYNFRKSICAPKFKIKDEDHKTVLKIEGPVCIIQGPCCRRDQEFVVCFVIYFFSILTWCTKAAVVV